MSKRATKLSLRITEYLSLGGNFNPELMDHQKVRDLLIDCRNEIDRLSERHIGLDNTLYQRLMSAKENSRPHPLGSIEGMHVRPIYAIHEHDLDALVNQITAQKNIIDGCNWYWDSQDREQAVDGPWDVYREAGSGVICEVDRGGVVETRFYAYLEPAEDSEDDEEFVVDEATYEEAKAKLDAEEARRKEKNV